MSMKHQTLMNELAGQHYNDVRTAIESVNWDGLYPEVDLDGDLTGYVIAAESLRHDVVDVTDTGILHHQHAADAMTLADAECIANRLFLSDKLNEFRDND